ncbi:MAG: NAD(P)/FAD-dependent oxidoreductase [Nanoarchaeota archaeon]|nr:NAD(P)/FAD-dependent oxidoreductase [Nanoarchaeota archaeon]
MISIIGAGPAGSAAAYLLAKAGKDVTIYEEHGSVGEPVQCTGIVTSALNKLVKPSPEFIVNEIRYARIYSPAGKNIEIKMAKPNLIIDRWAFDNYLCDKAEAAGARLALNSRFLGFSGDKLRIKNKQTQKLVSIASSIVIGADGPQSPVAKSAGIFGSRELLTGVQAVAYMKNDNAVEFYPYINTFGWVVPENEGRVRIGVLGKHNTVASFKKLLKLKGVKDKHIIEKQGGVVPIYSNKLRTCSISRNRRVYLVGDAAAQVKATTGGGIVPALIAAKCLADSIIHNRDYEKEWKKELGRDLWLHLAARRVMDRFSYKDWNRMIEIFSRPKNRKVLEEIDRDNPSSLFMKLAMQEPGLWRFARKLF